MQNNKKLILEYGDLELDHLRRRDPALGRCIDEIGFLEREMSPDLFSALANSIVSQQISTKAAVTVWGRLLEKTGSVTPEKILNLRCEDIQSCGMSMRKAGYIRGAAEKISSGAIDLSVLYGMDDREVCRYLSRLDGIGEWTAEMLMIFSMGRKDVLSFKDFGIQKGLQRVYRKKDMTREMFEKYRRRYSPYASVASLYLWEMASRP